MPHDPRMSSPPCPKRSFLLMRSTRMFACAQPPASPSIGTPDGRMAATSRAASLASHSSFATPSAAGARLPPPGPGALARCGSFVPVLRNATSLAVAPGMGLRGGGSCSGRQPSAGSSRPSGSGTPLLLSPALSGAHDASPHRMCGVSPSRSWHPSAHCAPTAASRGLPPMLPPLATPPPPPPVHVALPDPAMSSGAATPEHLSQDLLLQSSMRSRSRAHDGMRGPAGSEHARPVHGVLVRVKQLRDRAFGPSPLQRCEATRVEARGLLCRYILSWDIGPRPCWGGGVVHREGECCMHALGPSWHRSARPSADHL
mmetsp:Transcript_14779/g.43408  ORF Transcript_14779/g.43408 Transcript_14779/m.43408 type:complete len:315 (-) Transcript_14779:1874-2818(-)|eukprot:359062-Chlamydomonas_euryale.AAC.7